ncbi:MAG: hypothetical protein NTV40_07335 [Solirubrobacterales bacterium]|nr:hypothetical protein [Solirubrobacterales bacterium]
MRKRPEWKALEAHHAELSQTHLRDLFAAQPGRGEQMTAEAVGLYLDYSKHRATDETVGLLIELARACGVTERRAAMFAGERINTTEGRAVLHVALRAPRDETIMVDGVNVVDGVHVDWPYGSAYHQHRQHRHRWFRPRAGDGLSRAA